MSDPNQNNQPDLTAVETAAAPPKLKLRLLIGGEPDSAGDESHYSRNQLLIVRENQEIAQFVEAEEGWSGGDMRLGDNVAMAADGKTVIAKTNGCVNFEAGMIWVEKAMQIVGDVDFSTGNIDFAQDVWIGGSVIDLFKVTSGGSISVMKAVEAAEIRAVKDLLVRGGIVGKEKGRCFAGRHVRARFITNASIEAGGDVQADAEIANCHITCGGRLTVRHGPLISGHAVATGGISCFTLGSSAGVKTVAEAGSDDTLRASLGERLARLDDQRKKAAKIRELVEPLMRNQKALTPAQKEKATELLYEAAEMEEKASGEVEALRRQHASMQVRCKTEIAVVNMVHPGVVIRFPGLEATVNRVLRGPIHIAPTEMDGQQRIAVCNDVGGSVIPLETRSIADEAMRLLERLVGRAA